MLADRHGLLVTIPIAPAAPASFVEATLASRLVTEAPQRWIGDRAYDGTRWMMTLASEKDRTDRSAQKEPGEASDTGWTQPETLPESLADRALEA